MLSKCPKIGPSHANLLACFQLKTVFAFFSIFEVLHFISRSNKKYKCKYNNVYFNFYAGDLLKWTF